MRTLAATFLLCFLCLGATAEALALKDSLGRDFIVMPASSFQQALRLFPREKSAYWQPSMSGVQKTAELIHAALVRAKEGSVTDLVGYPVGDGRIEFVTRKIEEVLLRYPSYMCQVIGFNDAGKKFIAFSFSPSEPDRARKNIDSQFIEVLDGGAGYWRIEFDVAEKRFVRFESNGDA